MFASRRNAPILFFTAAWLLLGIDHSAAQQLLLGPSLPNTAITPESPEPSSSPSVSPAAAPASSVRAENAQQLREAQRKLEAGGAESTAAHEVAFYQTREAVLAQQEVVEQQIKDLAIRKADLDSQLKSSALAENPMAFTFAELDQLKDELAAEEARLNLVNDKLSATKAGVEKARAALDESEAKRRQAQVERDSAKGQPNHTELAIAAEQARLNAQLAQDSLTLRKRELDRDALTLEVQTLLVQVCKDRVARMSPLVVMTKADYQRQLDDIKAKEETANDWLRTAQSRLHGVNGVNVRLREAQEQYNAATGDRTIATETLEGERRAREKLTDEIDCLTQRLQRLAQLRVAWTHRHNLSLAKTQDADRELWGQLKSLQKETKGILGGLAEDLRMEILRMRDLRSSLTGVTKELDAADNGPDELRLALERQQRQIGLTLRIHERNLVMIETSRRVHEKLLDEIGLGVETLSPKYLAYGVWHQFEYIWNIELGSIDREYPITVKTVVQGLALLMGGWLLARFLSTLFANRLLKRFRMSRDATAAMRTLVFYVLLTIFVLHSLRTVGIPLTAFTILGGALAIGVGFGSQALINNFIGGLIMLAERPVRLGERITFGNFDGVVDEVGFRCTKLRTQSDHLVTIPNSTLVNESIENVDRRRTIRRAMNIQITYNTSRESIAAAVQAIRDILEEKEIRERIHPIVGFEEFPPQVHFTEFLAESLNIQIVYWYAPVDSRAYQDHCERVNYRIMEELDRLSVDFAFPSKTAYVKNAAKRGTATIAA